MIKEKWLKYLNDKFTAIIVWYRNGVENKFYCDLTELPHYLEQFDDEGVPIADVVIGNNETNKRC